MISSPINYSNFIRDKTSKRLFTSSSIEQFETTCYKICGCLYMISNVHGPFGEWASYKENSIKKKGSSNKVSKYPWFIGITINCAKKSLKNLPEFTNDPFDSRIIAAKNLDKNGDFANITVEEEYKRAAIKFWDPDYVEKVTLANNRLTNENVEISDWQKHLSIFARLKSLDLSQNKLGSFEKYSIFPYKFHDTIEGVDLSLTPFAHLKELRTLTISKNKLQRITRFYFSGLKKLEILDLSRNNISTVDSKSFRDLHNLRKLDLSNNAIENVDGSVWFLNTPLLYELSIDYNHIFYIDKFAFSHVKNLKTLSMAYNKIFKLRDDETGLKNLRVLNLTGNRFEKVPIYALTKMGKLKYLWFDDNAFNKLKTGDFRDLLSLTFLSISYNEVLEMIDFKTFKNLPRLFELEIHDNPNLIYFDAFAWENEAPNLTILRLHNNMLSYLDERIVSRKVYPLIKEISFYGNPITCDCHMMWLFVRNYFKTNQSQKVSNDNKQFNEVVSRIEDAHKSIECEDRLRQRIQLNYGVLFDEVDKMICRKPEKLKGLTLCSILAFENESRMRDIYDRCRPKIIYPDPLMDDENVMYKNTKITVMEGQSIRLMCRSKTKIDSIDPEKMILSVYWKIYEGKKDKTLSKKYDNENFSHQQALDNKNVVNNMGRNNQNVIALPNGDLYLKNIMVSQAGYYICSTKNSGQISDLLSVVNGDNINMRQTTEQNSLIYQLYVTRVKFDLSLKVVSSKTIIISWNASRINKENDHTDFIFNSDIQGSRNPYSYNIFNENEDEQSFCYGIIYEKFDKEHYHNKSEALKNIFKNKSVESFLPLHPLSDHSEWFHPPISYGASFSSFYVPRRTIKYEDNLFTGISSINNLTRNTLYIICVINCLIKIRHSKPLDCIIAKTEDKHVNTYGRGNGSNVNLKVGHSLMNLVILLFAALLCIMILCLVRISYTITRWKKRYQYRAPDIKRERVRPNYSFANVNFDEEQSHENEGAQKEKFISKVPNSENCRKLDLIENEGDKLFDIKHGDTMSRYEGLELIVPKSKCVSMDTGSKRYSRRPLIKRCHLNVYKPLIT
ncbi:uncharacterized protein LOC135930881 isoform X2 [Gordionus sp. m RMFG-2023]